MEQFSKEQLSAAKNIIEYLNKSFIEDNGILNLDFDDALLEYRKEQTRENYIKVLCTLCLSDVYMPYRPVVVEGEEVWDISSIQNKEGFTAQFIASSPEKISMHDAMKNLWYRDDGVRFFTKNNHCVDNDFLIVNHETDFFQCYSSDIKKIAKYISKLDYEDCDYTQEDILDFAEILSNERCFLESKKYRCNLNGQIYNGFYYFTHDNRFNSFLHIVDKKDGLIRITEKEYSAMEEIA